MKKKLLIPVLISAVFISATGFNLAAQSISTNADASVQIKAEKKKSLNRNFVKINITSIVLKNYSLQYERTLNKNISFALSYRLMPTTTVPFQQSIVKLIGESDAETKKTVEDLTLSNYAITPEVRFYLSRHGFGRGFYIAPFYRHASFKTNDVNIFYTDDANAQSSIKLSGKLTSNTGGLLFGVQKLLGKHIVLDTWLFGPHYGLGKGVLKGTPGKPLSQNEQDALREELNGIDIPLTDKSVEVSANNASLKVDGPWGGLRAGIP